MMTCKTFSIVTLCWFSLTTGKFGGGKKGLHLGGEGQGGGGKGRGVLPLLWVVASKGAGGNMGNRNLGKGGGTHGGTLRGGRGLKNGGGVGWEGGGRVGGGMGRQRPGGGIHPGGGMGIVPFSRWGETGGNGGMGKGKGVLVGWEQLGRIPRGAGGVWWRVVLLLERKDGGWGKDVSSVGADDLLASLSSAAWCCWIKQKDCDSFTLHSKIYVWPSIMNLMIYISKDVRNSILVKIMSLLKCWRVIKGKDECLCCKY